MSPNQWEAFVYWKNSNRSQLEGNAFWFALLSLSVVYFDQLLGACTSVSCSKYFFWLFLDIFFFKPFLYLLGEKDNKNMFSD